MPTRSNIDELAVCKGTPLPAGIVSDGDADSDNCENGAFKIRFGS